ncbi:hypothetical protein ACFYNY_24985 [Streptomyces sp. NPDC006530]|uniref:hypothetical protein n=1 Tax=Streptomyces sp. NPDC006530 TaxID=3364750 RepID=UPI0036B8B14A
MTSREPLRAEELWQACVDAQEQLAHHHSRFFQQVRDKSGVLSAALSAGHWQRAAALAFLTDVHDDLDQLTDEDDDYYALWIEVLADAEAWTLLDQLVSTARTSPNLLLQDVAARVAESYGALITDVGDRPARAPSIQDVS